MALPGIFFCHFISYVYDDKVGRYWPMLTSDAMKLSHCTPHATRFRFTDKKTINLARQFHVQAPLSASALPQLEILERPGIVLPDIGERQDTFVRPPLRQRWMASVARCHAIYGEKVPGFCCPAPGGR